MPCDTYSSHIVVQDYADCIDYIETIFNKTECNYVFVLEIVIRTLVD